MLIGLIDKKLSLKGIEPLLLNYEVRVLTIKLQAINRDNGQGQSIKIENVDKDDSKRGWE